MGVQKHDTCSLSAAQTQTCAHVASVGASLWETVPQRALASELQAVETPGLCRRLVPLRLGEGQAAGCRGTITQSDRDTHTPAFHCGFLTQNSGCHVPAKQLHVACCRHSQVGISCEVIYLPEHTLPFLARRHLPSLGRGSPWKEPSASTPPCMKPSADTLSTGWVWLYQL